MILLGPEILLNGGFEAHASSPQSWFVQTPGTISLHVISSYPFAGDNHASATTLVEPGIMFFRNQPPVIVSSGENYRVSAAIAPETDNDLTVQMITASTESSIGLAETFTPETTSIPSWHYYTWDFGCTRDTIRPMISIGITTTPSSRTVLFDSVSFRRKIDLSVGYDYKSIRTLDRILARNLGGSLRIYTGPGSHRKFHLPASWVSSKDASSVNSWWQTGADLKLIENDDYPNSFYSVRIVGNEQPLNQYQGAYFGEFLIGELNLETV
jgi:hypothetical protein